jgi:hypothetical protein
MKFLFKLSPHKNRARKVNQVKAESDKDKENILSFKASLVLASPHYKINWMTCSNVILPSSPQNFENSITPRVRELVVVIRVGFLIGASLAFELYAKVLSQNSS